MPEEIHHESGAKYALQTQSSRVIEAKSDEGRTNENARDANETATSDGRYGVARWRKRRRWSGWRRSAGDAAGVVGVEWTGYFADEVLRWCRRHSDVTVFQRLHVSSSDVVRRDGKFRRVFSTRFLLVQWIPTSGLWCRHCESHEFPQFSFPLVFPDSQLRLVEIDFDARSIRYV